MKYFYGYEKTKTYFEGWYCKIQTDKDSIAFIPSYHIDHSGKRIASLQIVWGQDTYSLEYPVSEFSASEEKFQVQVGKSKFGEGGFHIDTTLNGIDIQGDIRYGELCKPKYSIMGPFSILKGMQCNHGVISMVHTANGILFKNGKSISIHGLGYMEKDWGCSFPNTYFWTQCIFKDVGRSSIMVSIADIPITKKNKSNFTGCICHICHRKQDYRIATYYGCKIKKYEQDEIIIKQGSKELIINIFPNNLNKENKNISCLKAPIQGTLLRTIKESISTRIRYRFFIKHICIFDIVSEKASYEFVR